MNEDEAVQISDPVIELPSEEDIQSDPEVTAPPMEVIPVDEFFERLDEYFSQGDPAPEESEELEELPSDELEEAAESVEEAPDLPAADSDPLLGVVDHLLDMISDLGKIEAHTREIQLDVMTMVQTVDHPALTTPFEDYTVSEALLLFLLLAAFVSACARMLRGGFSWLRS